MTCVQSSASSLRRLRAIALASLALTGGVAASAWAGTDPVVLLSRDGVSITQEGSANSWVIENEVIRMSLGINAQGSLAVSDLRQPAAESGWEMTPLADVSVVAGGKRLTPGSGDFRFGAARVEDEDGALRLVLVFESPSTKVRATRTYACFPGAPAIETWTRFEPYQTSSAVTLTDIGLWQLTVGGDSVHWLTGLSSSPSAGEAFSLREAPMALDLNIGAEARSTSTHLPVIWVDGPAGHLFAGLLWSGAWSIVVTPPAKVGHSAIRASLGTTTTTVGAGASLETPHGFYGVAGVAEGDLPRAIGAYMMKGVRHGRPFSPLVTYNTWYAYGIKIDEATLLAQMDRAAALGVEVFVVDAGWYTGGKDASDFTTGLGRWTADPARFPNGLRVLGDHAHALGMKFGIWMEPERADASTFNRTGLVQESWLATSGGRYDPGIKNSPFAQICLASAEARKWVVDQVSRVVEESGADYLKWDNNFWINCNRSGHGHGALDGNLAHHLGLYDVLAQLRERFPELIIENCASGGNRLDPGMLRFTDTAWMDDVSSPSAHVRRNLQGLGAIYPPAYLLSFVKDDPAELIHQADDMAFLFRSRMPGLLGLSIRPEEFGERDTEQMVDGIALYALLRTQLSDASLLALTPQDGGADGWDVVELLSASSGDAVVYAFATGEAADRTTIRLQGLDPDATYVVSVPGRRVLDTPTGSELMLDGIRVRHWPGSASLVLLVTKQHEAEPTLR